MPDERNILNGNGEPDAPTAEDRRLEALLAGLPRRRCPERVRRNVMAALRSELEVSAGAAAASPPRPAKVVPLYRRRFARFLEAAALVAVVAIGYTVYRETSGRFRFEPAGEAVRETATPAARALKDADADLLYSTAAPSAVGADERAEKERLRKKIEDIAAVRDEGAAGKDEMAKTEAPAAVAPAEEDKKVETAAGRLERVAGRPKATPTPPSPTPMPPAAAPLAALPVVAAGRPSDQKTQSVPVAEASTLDKGADAVAFKIEEDGRKSEVRSLREASDTEKQIAGAPGATQAPAVPAQATAPDHGRGWTPALELAAKPPQGKAADKAETQLSASVEYGQPRQAEIPPAQTQARDHAVAAAQWFDWYEIETSAPSRAEILARNTIQDVRWEETNEAAAASRADDAWSRFSESAVVSFAQFVETWGGAITDSQAVVVTPGNRRAILVECSVPAAHSRALQNAVHQKRLVAVAAASPPQHQEVLRLSPARGGGGMGQPMVGEATVSMRSVQTPPPIRRLNEYDLAANRVLPFTNFFVQSPPANQQAAIANMQMARNNRALSVSNRPMQEGTQRGAFTVQTRQAAPFSDSMPQQTARARNVKQQAAPERADQPAAQPTGRASGTAREFRQAQIANGPTRRFGGGARGEYGVQPSTAAAAQADTAEAPADRAYFSYQSEAASEPVRLYFILEPDQLPVQIAPAQPTEN